MGGWTLGGDGPGLGLGFGPVRVQYCERFRKWHGQCWLTDAGLAGPYSAGTGRVRTGRLGGLFGRGGRWRRHHNPPPPPRQGGPVRHRHHVVHQRPVIRFPVNVSAPNTGARPKGVGRATFLSNR